MQPTSARRQRLGAELRRLREMAGHSGRAMAAEIGISQAGISRIETGTRLPTLPEARAWARAVDADAETTDRLMADVEAAYTDVETWRHSLAGARHFQTRAAEIDRITGRLRSYQAFIVPGLMHTADYARRIFELCAVPGMDIPAAVTARLERQRILYEPSRAFEFIVTESALRYPAGPASVLRSQLGRLLSLASLDQVDLAVIPLRHEPTRLGWHSFVIHDHLLDNGEPFVDVELAHADVSVADPQDVATYEAIWKQLAASALRAQSALEFVEAVAKSL
jgi:transcriptional regulator with XRE-family HTH domain